MQDQKTTNCLACNGRISPLAIKCQNCGSFQNWQRYSSKWGPVVSLLLGLVAVISLITPQISSLLKPEFRYSVSKLSVGFRGLHLHVDNTGRKPIVLGQAAIYYPYGSNFLKTSDENYVVHGDSEKLLELVWDENCERCEERPDEIPFDAVSAYKMSEKMLPIIPHCGLLLTFNIQGEDVLHTLRYEQADPETNYGRCNDEFRSFLTGKGWFE